MARRWSGWFLIGAGPALAAHFAGRDGNAANEIVRDRQRLYNSRKELRKDLAELRRNRMELRRYLRHGASDVKIARERREVRDSLRKVAKSRRELGRARAELERDLERRFNWHSRNEHNRWSSGSRRYYGWRDYPAPWARSRHGGWKWHDRWR